MSGCNLRQRFLTGPQDRLDAGSKTTSASQAGYTTCPAAAGMAGQRLTPVLVSRCSAAFRKLKKLAGVHQNSSGTFIAFQKLPPSCTNPNSGTMGTLPTALVVGCESLPRVAFLTFSSYFL